MCKILTEREEGLHKACVRVLTEGLCKILTEGLCKILTEGLCKILKEHKKAYTRHV